MLAFNQIAESQDSEKSEVAVKVAGPFDLGRLSRLHKGCFTDGWSRSDVSHILTLPGSFGLIGRLNRTGFPGLENFRGVGFALCRVARDECELLSIGVLPGFRRRGVAKALLEASMVRCHLAGAEKMFLEVAMDNAHAQALYAELGFKTVGTRPNYYQRGDGTRAHAYTMQSQSLKSA